MNRKEFPVRVKKAALKRATGKCEGCGQPLSAGRFAFDHVLPDGLQGPPTLENCQVLCVICHRQKTREDTAAMVKADNQKKAANNLKPPKAKIPQPLKAEKKSPKPRLPPRPLFEEMK